MQARQRDRNILAIVRRQASGATRIIPNKRVYRRKAKHPKSDWSTR